MGSIHSVSVAQDHIDELGARSATMSAHRDVPAGLKQLKDAGFRLSQDNAFVVRSADRTAKQRRYRWLFRKIVQY
jgi:hypothetical protein